MKASSSQPTDVVLESFIDLTGEPLLHVGPTTGTKEVTLAQERLLPRGQSDGGQAPSPVWKIPICPSNAPCAFLTESKTSLLLPTSEKRPLFLSRNGSGYFVADYAKSDRDLFRAHLDELSPAERISYNGTEWLLTRTMHRDAGEYLQLVLAMPRARSSCTTRCADTRARPGPRRRPRPTSSAFHAPRFSGRSAPSATTKTSSPARAKSPSST